MYLFTGTKYSMKASFTDEISTRVSIINPSRPDPGRREKINLNFYFHTSLWCLKRFYEGLLGLSETFRGTIKKCENKNLS